VLTASQISGTFAGLTGQPPSSSDVSYGTVYGPGSATVVVDSLPGGGGGGGTGGGGGGGSGGGSGSGAGSSGQGAPVCTLTLVSAKVSVKPVRRGSRHKRRGHVTERVSCNQSVAITLRAAFQEVRTATRAHGPGVRVFKAAPILAKVIAGRPAAVAIRLPAGALAAVLQHHRVRLIAKLTAANPNGSLTVKKPPTLLRA
jgi:hypothetical protein